MSGTQCLVSYLVRSTPSGNVRVSTRFRFTQLSRAVKNGVPPPTRTGWVTIAYSSISPARMAAAARVAPPTAMGPPSSVLSRVISVTASPVTRRAFQSTALVVEENTTFGMSRQRRGERVSRGVRAGAAGAGLRVGGRPVGAHRLPQLAPVQRQARRPHPVGPPLEQLVARHAPAEVVAGRGDVAVQAQVHAKGQFPHGSGPQQSSTAAGTDRRSGGQVLLPHLGHLRHCHVHE